MSQIVIRELTCDWFNGTIVDPEKKFPKTVGYSVRNLDGSIIYRSSGTVAVRTPGADNAPFYFRNNAPKDGKQHFIDLTIDGVTKVFSPPVCGAPTATPAPVATAPAPAATTPSQAILSAASGGSIMPSSPSPIPPSPIPSPESMVVAAKAPVAAKPAGSGAAIAAGAGAGFLVGGPAGALVGAIAAGMIAGRKPAEPVAGFDGFFKRVFKGAKKAFSSPKKAFSTIGKAIAAPLVIPTAIATKATTYALGKTGIKPLKKLDTAVGRVYRGKLVKSTRDIYAAELAIGATVAAGIVAAPYVGAAASAVGVSGAATAAKLAKGLMTPKEAIVESSSMPEAPSIAVAPPQGKTNIGAILAGVGAGFLFGGPPGAIIGGVAGSFVKKKG